MPNERYVKISMRDRWDKIPYDANGDPNFAELFANDAQDKGDEKPALDDIFSKEEIVHLCNKALYVMKYQRETHAQRNAARKKTRPREAS